MRFGSVMGPPTGWGRPRVAQPRPGPSSISRSSGGDPIASGGSRLGPSGEMFETSIRALRGRADELQQLHIREQERADELAQVGELVVDHELLEVALQFGDELVAAQHHAGATVDSLRA